MRCGARIRQSLHAMFVAMTAAMLAFGAGLNPAAADFGDLFFGTLKKGLANTPLDDPVEMARYTAYERDNATIVYERAIAGGYYAYVFFGLVAGVKSFKGKHFQDLGTFTYESCIAPHTFVDIVFSKLDGFMDGAAAEVDFGEVGDAIKQYAVDYGKAQSQESKDELNKEINEQIPFWEDIPVICHFGFFTNFKRDKALQQTVWTTVDGLVNAYRHMEDAKIADATSDLLTLGINETLICQLADDAIAGGWMNKIPAVGDIGNTLCSEFTGFIINAADAFSDALETIGAATGISDVGDWLAGQTKHMPPEEYYQKAWLPLIWDALLQVKGNPGFDFGGYLKPIWEGCKTYFDEHTMSESTAKEVCNQQRNRFSATYADAARYLKARRDLGPALDAMRQSGPKEFRFSSLWGSVKPDPKKTVDVIAEPGTVAALALTRLAAPAYEVKKALHSSYATLQPAMLAERLRWIQRAEELKAAQKAVANAVAKQADDAEKAYIGPWLKKCGDDICRSEMLNKREMCRAKRIQAINDNPVDPDNPQSLKKRQAALSAADKACEPAFEVSIAASIKRLLDDRGAGLDATLAKIGCNHFLGRAKEKLCVGKAAFEACKSFVDQNLLAACTLGGGAPVRYVNKLIDDPKADPLVRMALLDCKNAGGEVACPGAKGFGACKQAAEKGLVKVCVNTQSKEKYFAKALGNGLTAGSGGAQGDARVVLAAERCKLNGGQNDDWLCPRRPGYLKCLAYLDQNKAAACTGPGQPRKISLARLEKAMVLARCKRGRPVSGTARAGASYFTCTSGAALAACRKAKVDFIRPETVRCEIVAAATEQAEGTHALENPVRDVKPADQTGVLAPTPKMVGYRATIGQNRIAGRFEKVRGDNWVETVRHSAPQQVRKFSFRQMEAKANWIDLLDKSRNIWVRLDIGGRQVLISSDGRKTWNKLYTITTTQ